MYLFSAPTLSMGLYYYGLIVDFLKEDPSDTFCIQNAKKAGLSKMEKYYKLASVNQTYLCASVLDPRIKKTIFDDESQVKKTPLLIGTIEDVLKVWASYKPNVSEAAPKKIKTCLCVSSYSAPKR